MCNAVFDHAMQNSHTATGNKQACRTNQQSCFDGFNNLHFFSFFKTFHFFKIKNTIPTQKSLKSGVLKKFREI